MVRVRKRDAVELQVTGPRSIVRQSFVGMARWNENWYQFFAGCGLTLTPEDGVYVRTRENKMKKMVDGEAWGWNAELDEPVRNFLSKFERLKQSHTIRLMLKDSVPVRTRTPAANRRPKKTQNSTNGRQPARIPSSSSGSSPNLVVAGPSIIIQTGPPPAAPRRTPSATISTDYRKPRYTPPQASNANRGDRYGTRQRSRPINNGNRSDTQSTTGRVGRRYNNNNRNNVMGPPRRTRNNVIIKQEPVEPVTPQIDPTSVRTLVKVEPPHITIEMENMEEEEEETMGMEQEETMGMEQEETMRMQEETGGEEEGDTSSNTSDGNNAEVGGNGNGDFDEDDATNGTNNERMGVDEDDEEDNLSMCTALTAEETELRRQGIRVEDIKSLAERRMGRFSNAFMLRVRAEIKKLRKNALWDRNVTRSPLACYMLQEMFKES